MITHITGNGNETCPRLIPSSMQKRRNFPKPDWEAWGLGYIIMMLNICIVSLGLSAYVHILIITDNPLQKDGNGNNVIVANTAD